MDDDNRRLPLAGLAVMGANLGGLGCTIPILIMAAIFAGRALDRWLGTQPWILLALLLLAVVLGLVIMVSSALQSARAAQRQYQQRRGEGRPPSPQH
mgnify:CR=1 FL=1